MPLPQALSAIGRSVAAQTAKNEGNEGGQGGNSLADTVHDLTKEINPVYLGSQWWLRTGWIAIIPSFGLSVFFMLIPYAIFRYWWPYPPSQEGCRLGEEWLPAGATNFSEYPEIIGMLFVAVIYGILYVIIFVSLVSIVDAWANPIVTLFQTIANFLFPTSPSK